MPPHYFSAFSDLAPELWTPRAESCLREIVSLMRSGGLTKDKFQSLIDDPQPSRGQSFLEKYLLRERCIQEVGFVVITKEYLDSLTRLLKGCRVVEVCAGMGTFQELMRERGVDWTSTDSDPWDGSKALMMDALEAIDLLEPDVVFASWVDYQSDLDHRIAQRCPGVFINECCTGSEDFGKDTPTYRVVPAPSWFEDVPSWPGLWDHTLLTAPKGMSIPFNE